MRRFMLAAVAVLALSEATPARAQFGFGHGHHVGHPHFGYPAFSYPGFGYSYRSGFGFALGGPHFRLVGFSGGFATYSAFLPPPVFGPIGFAPLFPFGPFAAFGPPVVAVPVPVPVVVAGGFPDPNADPLAGNAPPREDRALFPKGDFLVIAPKKEPPIPDAAKVARVERPPPRPPGPVIPFDPFRPPAKVAAEVPEADPKREAARLAKLGRESFAAGDYGRAAEHFGRASAADPADATAYFLRAQAQFAAGQFAEAVAAIRAGLARDPKWPGTAFDPAALYGDKPEKFALHVLALKKALGENPGEATLEFLLGYELWFGGDKPEAKKHFAAAEKRLPAPGPIALFK